MLVPAAVCAIVVFSSVPANSAASPTVEQALSLMPIQKGVDISTPTAGEIEKCKMTARKSNGRVGWVVEDPDGLILRRFVDSNGDNTVDRWSYFKDGLEVYRDVDTDFNRKADQCCWFHTGGSRRGIDRDEDGTIDRWETISAEEVSAELIAALANRDADRFARLVLTTEELPLLGLGKEKADAVAAKIDGLAEKFRTLAAKQTVVKPQTRWVHFSGTQPGVVPAGTEGSTKDVRVYENVVAVVETAGEHGQVLVGTLIRLGDLWRLIDLPQPDGAGATEVASRGLFFQPPNLQQSAMPAAGPNEQSQKLLDELEKLDQLADRATTPQQQAEHNARRVALLEKMAEQASDGKERAMWYRQLADTVGAAVQVGSYPDGIKKLQSLLELLAKDEADEALAAHVKFLLLTAEYGQSLQAKDANFVEIQAKWLKDLEQYATDYPKAIDTAEAMLQLAIAREFAGGEEHAKQWYARIVKEFPGTPAAKKAAGARIRLDSVGKTIRLTGRTATGSVVDLAKYRGRVVVIQYWATWCEPCKRDMPLLKELLTKYGRSMSVIGVSLDNNAKDLTDYLAENRLPWPQIYESGGLDSEPANQLGILSLPTMLLIDKEGKVVNRNVRTDQLEAELKKLIPATRSVSRPPSGSAGKR
ncbi:MAG: redoxin family protein [Candidatus Nealsonbacteria bacterium]|nr:redoxin family protein [Candidatus Nealsonbacteria bacterium]